MSSIEYLDKYIDRSMCTPETYEHFTNSHVNTWYCHIMSIWKWFVYLAASIVLSSISIDIFAVIVKSKRKITGKGIKQQQKKQIQVYKPFGRRWIGTEYRGIETGFILVLPIMGEFIQIALKITNDLIEYKLLAVMNIISFCFFLFPFPFRLADSERFPFAK